MVEQVHKRTFADIPIFEADEMTSTQEVVRQLIDSGEIRPKSKLSGDSKKMLAVISTKYQSQGKGRRARTWDTKPSSAMLASFVLDSDPQNLWLDVAHLLSVVIRTINGSDEIVKIKWPNDLVVNDGQILKVGGCLTEIMGSFLSVGIGINLTSKSYPPELAYKASSLDELGKTLEAPDLVQDIISNFTSENEQSKTANQKHLEYKLLSATIGREVKLEQINRQIKGEAIDVDIDGALQLRLIDGTIVKAVEGDVVHASL